MQSVLQLDAHVCGVKAGQVSAPCPFMKAPPPASGWPGAVCSGCITLVGEVLDLTDPSPVLLTVGTWPR